MTEIIKAQNAPPGTTTFTTSLYIPGYEGPLPVNADVLGIGSDGRTTWALQDGTSKSSAANPPVQLVGTGMFLRITY